jgi:hypothetical protein
MKAAPPPPSGLERDLVTTVDIDPRPARPVLLYSGT